MTTPPESDLVLTEEQMRRYREALTKVGADKRCARCNHPAEQFGMLPAQHSLTFFHLHEGIRGVQEQSLDTVAVACMNCGAVYLHATGVLERIAQESERDDG